MISHITIRCKIIKLLSYSGSLLREAIFRHAEVEKARQFRSQGKNIEKY